MTTVNHAEPEASLPARTPVDAHAHYYHIFDRCTYLNAAVKNMAAAAAPDDAWGILLLAEPRAEGDPLASWRSPALEIPGWSIRATAEESALIAGREDGAGIVLVAGRQLVTIEGLEVLALAMHAEMLIRRPLGQTIEQVRLAGGIPVVPWGFGKWWGRRGRVLMDLLAAGFSRPFLLGDSACRPRIAHDHRALKLASESGIGILPGSDPLPIAAHEGKVGSYGFLLPGELDRAKPAAQVRDYLAQLRTAPANYGERASATSFMVSQISLRVARKRAMLTQL